MKPRQLIATVAVPGAEQLRRHCQIKPFWFVNTRFAGRANRRQRQKSAVPDSHQHAS